MLVTGVRVRATLCSLVIQTSIIIFDWVSLLHVYMICIVHIFSDWHLHSLILIFWLIHATLFRIERHTHFHYYTLALVHTRSSDFSSILDILIVKFEFLRLLLHVEKDRFVRGVLRARQLIGFVGHVNCSELATCVTYICHVQNLKSICKADHFGVKLIWLWPRHT